MIAGDAAATGELAARLAAVHLDLAHARDERDVVAAIARAVAPYAPDHIALRYLELDGGGGPVGMTAVCVWEDGAEVPDHVSLGRSLRLADSTLSQHWQPRPRELLIVADVDHDPRCDDSVRANLQGRRGLVFLPLYSSHPEGWQGVLSLQWRAPHDPGEEERLICRLLMHTVAAFVAGHRNLRALDAALVEASALHRVSMRINEASTPAELLAAITEVALTAGAVQGMLYTVEVDDGGAAAWLRVAAAHTTPPAVPPAVGVRQPIQAMPLWSTWAADPDAPVTVDDVGADPRVDPAAREFHRGIGVRAAMLLPLRLRARTIGFVQLGWPAVHRFDDGERRFYRGLARQAAAVLDNRLLYERTRRAVQDNRSQHRVLEALLEHLPLGVLMVDAASGAPCLINRVGHELLGLAPGAALTGLNAYPPGDDTPIPPEEGLTRRALVTGETQSGEVDLERVDGSRIALGVIATPIRDDSGRITAVVSLLQDLRRRRAAERERTRMQAELIAAQAAALAERGTPVIPLSDAVVVVPLVGSIDAERGRHLVGALAELAGRAGVRAAILDVTGVPAVDADAAAALVEAARVLRLRGAVPVLTGLRGEVAWSLADLGVDLRALVTRATLRDGIAHARTLT